MKRNSFVRKALAGFTAATVLSTLFISTQVNAGPTAPPFNYAEAFQKSLYFYDAEKCGPGITGGKIEWRGDCHLEDSKVPLVPASTGGGTDLSQSFITKYKSVLDPDGDGTVDLHGGYHDAGDHIKFGLPFGYALSTMGWGFSEFRDSYKAIGEEEHMLDLLKWGNDYLLRSTFMDSTGEVVAFCYQLGDGSDHAWWQPPELNEKEKLARPAFFATAESPASDMCGNAVASLAINYLNFKETDLQYANKCLNTAKALYKFAVKYRGLGSAGKGFYGSTDDNDEMAWGAVWLGVATGDNKYFNDITAADSSGAYTGYFKAIMKNTSDVWKNVVTNSSCATQNWNEAWTGVFLKLAPIANTKVYSQIARWNLDYWSGLPHEDPSDTTYLKATPAGFRVANTWGSARYNSTAQLCALIYTKNTGEKKYADWAKTQMDYILGDNPLKRCYEVGYSDISAQHPHHRAAHGSDTLSMDEPKTHKHTIWGALVGGPDGSDEHNDSTTEFVLNEVTIDYNAGFVGALAAIYKYYGAGQKPLANFPPKETPTQEYYIQSKLEQESNERTQVTIEVHNNSLRPPHFETTMKARYFFDISELIKAGQSISDVSASIIYDESGTKDGKSAKIKGPFAWDEKNGIYYVEFDWSGISIYGDRELHFALISKQDPSTFKANWDGSNDWSRKGIVKGFTTTANIPLYLGDKKVFGNEPSDGVIEKPAGDIDGNGQITMVDALMLKKYILKKMSKLPDPTAADLNKDGNINSIDYLLLKQKITKI